MLIGMTNYLRQRQNQDFKSKYSEDHHENCIQVSLTHNNCHLPHPSNLRSIRHCRVNTVSNSLRNLPKLPPHYACHSGTPFLKLELLLRILVNIFCREPRYIPFMPRALRDLVDVSILTFCDLRNCGFRDDIITLASLIARAVESWPRRYV